VIAGNGFAGAALGVQGRHQLGDELLVKGVCRNETVEFVDDLHGPAQAQQRVRA
jgi:hypothetical protein